MVLCIVMSFVVAVDDGVVDVAHEFQYWLTGIKALGYWARIHWFLQY